MSGSTLTSEEIARITTPLLFGCLANWTLYGVLCVQTYVYSYNFPNDRSITKILVYSVFALETIQTALTGADIHYWFIRGFGNLELLFNSHYSPIDLPIIGAIITLPVQMYFCYRIWTLSRNVWLCSLIIATSVVSAIGEAWGGIASVIAGKYAVSKIAYYLWSLPSAMADIMIATAMTMLLKRTHGNECSFSRFVLVRVVRLTIETNIVTASVAITAFVLYVAFPNQIYYTFTAAIIGKLYSNTLLVSLNNRIYFRDQVSGSSGGSNSRLTSSSRARAAGTGSIPFTTGRGDGELRPIEVYKFETITASHPENGMGDSVSLKTVPSHGEISHFKTAPSTVQSSSLGRE